MSSSEKDKLGEKLHDVEAARENEWARQRDQELLEKMRAKAKKSVACPECGQTLAADPEQGLAAACPQQHGAWLDWETVIKIMGHLGHR